MTLRPCAKPGCGALVERGRCDAHAIDRGSGWAVTRKKRATVFGKPCARCGAPATERDHIVPLSRGGSDADANTQALCSPCHRAKTRRERSA